MAVPHLEILVEEFSAELFLKAVLPKMLGGRATFEIRTFQGKSDLLGKLEVRLRGYARWLPEGHRILVLVDRDDDDCLALKAVLELRAAAAGLATRNDGAGVWRVANRIAIEELEAWYFGEWDAVLRAYPSAPADAVRKAPLRHCDQIAGGTWEALERVLQKGGYFSTGLRKAELAKAIGEVFDPTVCRSPSFRAFRSAILDAVS